MLFRALLRGAAVASITALAHADGSGLPACAYQTSALDAFIAIGNPEEGQAQQANAAWTFRRSDMGGALLTRVNYPLNWTGPAWGAAEQPFFVPIVGPVNSPNAAENQNSFQRRPPSFRGLFFHPGYGTIESRMELAAPLEVQASALMIRVEHLGNFSPDAFVGAVLRRPGGDITLIPATRVVALAAALTLNHSSGTLPRNLQPGERIVVWTSNGGDPSEDWLNLNATLTLFGPPVVVLHPPAPAPGCSGEEKQFRVVAPGATSYRWRLNGTPIFDEPGRIAGAATPTLTITGASLAHEGLYSCTVGNDCGTVTTSAARLSVCLGDFNCDGGIDGGDVDAFYSAWEGGDFLADVNADGGIDGADVELFFARWEDGC